MIGASRMKNRWGARALIVSPATSQHHALQIQSEGVWDPNPSIFTVEHRCPICRVWCSFYISCWFMACVFADLLRLAIFWYLPKRPYRLQFIPLSKCSWTSFLMWLVEGFATVPVVMLRWMKNVGRRHVQTLRLVILCISQLLSNWGPNWNVSSEISKFVVLCIWCCLWWKYIEL